jgi:son of sevenless-like protein
MFCFASQKGMLADVTKTMEYRDAFFTTYIAFTTADDVFQSLVRRFHDAEAGTGQHLTLLRIK